MLLKEEPQLCLFYIEICVWFGNVPKSFFFPFLLNHCKLPNKRQYFLLENTFIQISSCDVTKGPNRALTPRRVFSLTLTAANNGFQPD